jgi:hypothetical protein
MNINRVGELFYAKKSDNIYFNHDHTFYNRDGKEKSVLEGKGKFSYLI